MIDNLTNILREENLRSVVAASVTIDHQEVMDQNGLQKRISAFNPQEGWLCLTDEVMVIRTPRDVERITSRIVLHGELVSGAVSLHIRQGESSWRLHTLTRLNGSGVMLEESFAPVPLAGDMWLRYETFWQDMGGILKPHASRFAGFQQNDKQGKEARL